MVYFVSHIECFDSHYWAVEICWAAWPSEEGAAVVVLRIPCFSVVVAEPSVEDDRIYPGVENHQEAQILGRLNLHIVDLMNIH